MKSETLLAKVEIYLTTRQVSRFVSGLKDFIKTNVRAARPYNLSSSTGLARGCFSQFNDGKGGFPIDNFFFH
jgi:hypothetical protein